MRVLLIGLFVLLYSVNAVKAQSPLGIWKSVDDTDGVAKSHIEIYKKGELLYGKVVKLLPAATITHCDKCKGEDKGRSLIEMVILKDLVHDGYKWSGGKIFDPAKGREYRCQIALEDPNTLKVRGYIGKPLFGRTQYWYRVETHNK